MNIQIPEPQKEVYERAGAVIVKMEHPAMSPVTMAVIQDKEAKQFICKLVEMFSPIKNHA